MERGQTNPRLPHDSKLHDTLHSVGFKVIYHTCRGTKNIEEPIVALIGGMDQFYHLASGTKEQIRAMVFKLFEMVGYNGGCIEKGNLWLICLDAR